MSMKEMLVHMARFFGMYIMLFIVVPLAGARVIWKSLERAQISGASYKDCATAYLYTSSAIFMVIFALNIIMGANREESYRDLVISATYIGMQMLLMPLLLRKFSGRAILVTEGAIIFTNVVFLGLIYLFFRN